MVQSDNKCAEGIVAQVAALSLVGAEVKDNLAILVKQRNLLAAENALLRSENKRYESQAHKPERNPYVAVLVDGDGYVFDDQYILNRNAGGQNAAQDLDQAVKKDLRSLDLEHCQIMVRVYADFVGLSKTLARAGLAGADKRSLAPLCADFTRSNELFDFCDAGELKEGADFKIRALFRHFIEDGRCKQIYFAGCHDTGYVAELTQHAASRDRITLVKHYAFHYHFSNLSMREGSLGEVFRTTPLEFDRMGAKPWKATGTPVIDRALAEGEETLAGPDRPACAYWPLGICKLGKACHFRHDKQGAQEPDPGSEATREIKASGELHEDGPFQPPSSPVTSVAHIASEEQRPTSRFTKLSTSLHRIKQRAFKNRLARTGAEDMVSVNRDGHRLDYYSRDVTSEDVEAYRNRTSHAMLCVKHHVLGYCNDGSLCSSDHGAAITEVVDVLKMQTFAVPCDQGGACRSLECTRGHICQRTYCVFRGGYEECNFSAEAHAIDFHHARFVNGELWESRSVPEKPSAELQALSNTEPVAKARAEKDTEAEDERTVHRLVLR
ncbi:hypothetical protein LTR27_007161 [Elasticomyces elasticus]|nr:hypothetical protein LTR27_007161 [Elasticomyces elasticus]